MELHVVGGFLGGGKTTAIINALKTLLAEGQRVGVITNDKGHYLVDTAFLGTANIPTAEVPGGCFRCNYGDFQEQIAQLQAQARPDVLFAESVGSCVDLVGPVLTPLAALSDNGDMHITYSVFADVRLLRRYLLGLPLPFSDNINYIFSEQLEEAPIIIINKADLLSPEEGDRVVEHAHRRYPGKTLLLQSSLTQKGVIPWLKTLHTPQPLPLGLKLNYDPYIAGAAELAWLDEQLTLEPAAGRERETVIHLIAAILAGLRQSAQPVAHLKFFVQDGETGTKLSFTALDEPDWRRALPLQLHAPITLLINARVQMPAERLRALMTQAVRATLDSEGVTYHTSETTAFAPHVPRHARAAHSAR